MLLIKIMKAVKRTCLIFILRRLKVHIKLSKTELPIRCSIEKYPGEIRNIFLVRYRDIAGLGHHLQDRNRDDVCGYYFLD